MSNLTDFFPGAGGAGGGGALPDPTYMRRYIHEGGYPNLKLTTTTIAYASDTGFWTAYDRYFDSIICTTDNTYFTVADVTSAANGGLLSHVIGPAMTTSGGTDFRITIDETEYLISTGSNLGFDAYRASMGVTLGRNTTSSSYTSSWTGSYDNHYTYFGTATNPINGGFILPNSYNNLQPLASISPTVYDAPYVRFETSCKVEVSCSSLYTAGGDRYQRAGAAVIIL
jgi:hypothetical protein